jgi:hypothetical protein
MKEDSDTKNPKENKEKSIKSKASAFLEKLDFAKLSEHIEDNSANDSRDSKSREENDHYKFPMLSDLLGPKRIKEIKSGKSKILMGIGISIGILFIFSGILMTMGSVDRVADNVVFGEKEVFSVFLILIGILLIACSVAYKFLGKSFFKGIDNDIESYNETSSDSTKNNIKKDNINRNNR